MLALGTSSWDDLFSGLEMAFSDLNSEDRLMQKLMELRQGTRSVMDYTAYFRSLVIELGDKAPDDHTLVFLYR